MKIIRTLLFVLIIGLCQNVFAKTPQDSLQKPYQTYTYALRDTCTLYLDFYPSNKTDGPSPCVIFVFGGGFFEGSRNGKHIERLAQSLNNKGIALAAIDYRLGLKGVKNIGPLNVKPLEHAILVATEDLISATAFLASNATNLRILPDCLIPLGSSAGAITCLQADYLLSNGRVPTATLPQGFRYGGIISFAGAIFSREGKPDYRVQKPAPTLFFHGTADRLVNYDKTKLFNLGLFGSNPLAKIFEKQGYPYSIRRYRDCGHEIAGFYNREIQTILDFIDLYIIKARPRREDHTIFDPSYLKNVFTKSAREVYR